MKDKISHVFLLVSYHFKKN